MASDQKVRRVDLWPDDWLGGISNLSISARGVYLTACLLIYSRGGPIEREHLRQMCPSRSRQFGPALDELIQRDKLLPLDGDMLDQRRCEVEIARAKERIEASKHNANSRWAKEPAKSQLTDDERKENNEVRNAPAYAPASSPKTAPKPDEEPAKSQLMASYLPVNCQLIDGECSENNKVADAPAMLAKRRSQEKKRKIKNLRGISGSAYAREGALGSAREAEPHSAEDKAAVDAIVAQVHDVLGLPPSGLRNGVYAEAAYARAITDHKRDTWLNNLAAFVGEHLDGVPAKIAAWEAIEHARNAGSRDATPPDVRRAVDALSRLREQSVAYAEAAE